MPPLDSVSCRFQVARVAVDAIDAVAPCPLLPAAPIPSLSDAKATPRSHQERPTPYQIGRIDVHKKMPAIVVAHVEIEGDYQFERLKVGTSPAELRALAERAG